MKPNFLTNTRKRVISQRTKKKKFFFAKRSAVTFFTAEKSHLYRLRRGAPNRKNFALVFSTKFSRKRRSTWKVKSFPRGSLFRLRKLRALYKLFDYRALQLLKFQQTIKFKKFKSIFFRDLNSAVGKKSKLRENFFTIQQQVQKSFFLYWFAKPHLHVENKLFYLKKKRFSAGHGQKIFNVFRYKSIYNYKRSYLKAFLGYFRSLRLKNSYDKFLNFKKNKRLSRRKSRGFVKNSSAAAAIALKRRRKKFLFAVNAKKYDVTKKEFFLTGKKFFNSLFSKNKVLVRRGREANNFSGTRKNIIFSRKMLLLSNSSRNRRKLFIKRYVKLPAAKKKLLRARREVFGFRHLFFSNDRKMPKYNFVLTLTASNSNMYVNVSDKIGQTLFYHTMRRVGFQTGGSFKRSSKVAVERLGIFIGKRLRKKRFVNKKFLVIFRGVTWRRRFILKYIRFGARRKIKVIGIVERSGLPHNGCKLKKRKHKRKSFLKLTRIKKKFRVRKLKRIFKNFAKRPVFFKKNKIAKFLELLKIKREARLKYLKVFRKRREFKQNPRLRRVLAGIRRLRDKKILKKKEKKIPFFKKSLIKKVYWLKRHRLF